MKTKMTAILISVLAFSIPSAPAAKAAAVLKGTTEGSPVSGSVILEETGGGLKMTALVSGASAGLHGFHIHEKGDCSAPDAMSAGGHFNPYAKKHGAPDSANSHSGDLGNLTADASGKATLTLWLDGGSVGTGKDGVIGRSVIVHAGPDDLKTDPTGNSGGRVACGVIAG